MSVEWDGGDIAGSWAKTRRSSAEGITSPLSTFQRQLPVLLICCAWASEASLRRRAASAFLRSRFSLIKSAYRRAFSNEIAACDDNNLSTAVRAGVNACDVRLFSRYSTPISLACFTKGRQRTDRTCLRR